MPKSLQEWLTHLESLHPQTIALGLERVAEVKQRLQLAPAFPIIVVGGTNGKGSVCAMLEAMLHAAGYRVGCYTSPHLLAYNERVRIAKQPVNDAELCVSFEQIEAVRSDIALTYFEFGTLAAMQCFISHEVEVAILEVGLGGRLDAVNVFDSDCAVVTSIDIDHTDYLGDTREKIAFEKAGVFRAGKVAVFGDTDMPEAIATQAKKIGAQLFCLGKQFSFKTHDLQWDYQGETRRSSLPFPALRGAYQLNNASSVLAALDVLKDKLPVSMAAVRRGLMEVELPGRFQVLPGKPVIILDVAHNPHAARALAKNLAVMPPFPTTYGVCAMLKDKDMAGVVRELLWQVDVWLVAGIAAPRGASADELAAVVSQELMEGEVRSFATVTGALHHACEAAGENDRIVAFGSFYTVAEAMRAKIA
ncbi:MAG: bifunctional tetrahydrofolate synthase/dihydrofolate synthase [Gallionellales bacterium 35-53-114]|jgi:dihydrofolate synthase/folylpolyglutamate synthase|nr:MAG: bifunctional tetrahydrofolate synthase/dihydrofolate synthase [Gallionellales bacterium 35-53-114]OYZ62815.1 MAG: bifunctional tetrahydrofolate synthase/dihydrofolate synthase [Gallionellales bacterium 24-53-125]OZB09890.1 MAG: bifunctional tetrahydrofolate synthase/dihydrofolate synthase [Gallionellales bacterium 39-52-133]HQS57542.1 bifunctional tetrahydrofolate synthase/dihydrofolate synthase [Gallionellaceae bacterium]HQS73996.1 bifunctional tetrahydrofolate synthase/dihydrofolate s